MLALVRKAVLRTPGGAVVLEKGTRPLAQVTRRRGGEDDLVDAVRVELLEWAPLLGTPLLLLQGLACWLMLRRGWNCLVLRVPKDDVRAVSLQFCLLQGLEVFAARAPRVRVNAMDQLHLMEGQAPRNMVLMVEPCLELRSVGRA